VLDGLNSDDREDMGGLVQEVCERLE
jgi:hypothetical protein